MTSDFFGQVTRIQAGETLGPISLGYSDFPRSAGWALSCILFNEAGPQCITTAAAGDDADSFKLTIAATATSTLRGNRTSFVIEAVHITNGTFVAERGALTVLWNPRTVTPEMTILANIRAVKAGLATDGQRTIALDGVQLQYMSADSLDAWEARYLKIVNAQIGKAGGNGGVYAIKMRTPQDNHYAAPWLSPYPPAGVR